MSVLLAGLGYVALALLAVLVVLLLAPLSARAAGEISDEASEGSFRLAWGGGLLLVTGEVERGLCIRLLGIPFRIRSDVEAAETGRRPARRRPKRPRSRKGPGARWFWENRDALVGLVGELLRPLHLRVDLDVAWGTGDPATTAQATGLLGLLARALQPWVVLRVEPDWLDPRFEARGRASTWLIPLQVLLVAAWILVRPSTRRLIAQARGRDAKLQEQGGAA